VASVTGVQYDKQTSVNNMVFGVPAAPRSVFSYDAATTSYRFKVDDYTLAVAQQANQDESTTFTPADITEDNATSTTAVVMRPYFGQGATSTLIRSKVGAANPDIALIYTSFGSFQYLQYYRDSTNAYDYRPFAYGIVTPAASVPTTGTATYSGRVMGRAVDASGYAVLGARTYELSGTITLTVDYASRTVTGSIVMTGHWIVSGQPYPEPDVSLGPITLTPASALTTLSRFSGSATGGGGFEGFLAGPGGEELGLTVQAVVADPRDPSRVQRVALSGAALRH